MASFPASSIGCSTNDSLTPSNGCPNKPLINGFKWLVYLFQTFGHKCKDKQNLRSFLSFCMIFEILISFRLVNKISQCVLINKILNDTNGSCQMRLCCSQIYLTLIAI